MDVRTEVPLSFEFLARQGMGLEPGVAKTCPTCRALVLRTEWAAHADWHAKAE